MPDDKKPIEANPTQNPKIASIVKKIEEKKTAPPVVSPEAEKLRNQIINLKKLTLIDKLLHYGLFTKAAQKDLDDAIAFNREIHKNMLSEIKKTPEGLEALLQGDTPEVPNA